MRPPETASLRVHEGAGRFGDREPRAAAAAGHEAWLESEIAGVIGIELLQRLVDGSRAHAARRVDEMEAAAELLAELGVEPRIATASGQCSLRSRPGRTKPRR